MNIREKKIIVLCTFISIAVLTPIIIYALSSDKIIDDRGEAASLNWNCGEKINWGGQNISTKQVGDRCWMNENLNTHSGIEIVGKEGINASFYYGTTTGDGRKVNSYYISNYYAGDCPDGWYIPSLNEWLEALYTFNDTISILNFLENENNSPSFMGKGVKNPNSLNISEHLDYQAADYFWIGASSYGPGSVSKHGAYRGIKIDTHIISDILESPASLNQLGGWNDTLDYIQSFEQEVIKDKDLFSLRCIEDKDFAYITYQFSDNYKGSIDLSSEEVTLKYIDRGHLVQGTFTIKYPKIDLESNYTIKNFEIPSATNPNTKITKEDGKHGMDDKLIIENYDEYNAIKYTNIKKGNINIVVNVEDTSTGTEEVEDTSTGTEEVENTSTGAREEDIPTLVNGKCGSANKKSFETRPQRHTLCEKGTVISARITDNRYTWWCKGSGGGDTVKDCYALKIERKREEPVITREREEEEIIITGCQNHSDCKIGSVCNNNKCYRGDITGDRKIKMADFHMFVRDFRAYHINKNDFNARSDLNNDGAINMLDYSIFIQSWRATRDLAEKENWY